MNSPGEKLRAGWRWLAYDFLGIFREIRLSYVPPLMVYFAAGVSAFTGIIESFFVKEELGLAASFLAGLAFWAGIPWALKMPLGHLVDLFWRRKSLFVYIGALLMAFSLLVMVGLTGYKEWMAGIMPLADWYILSVLVAPIGYVLQDVVADAMTVEAVPTHTDKGIKINEAELQRRHITMQTLGRIAIVGGGAFVAGLGGWLATTISYSAMYRMSLLIPVISIIGVTAGYWMTRKRRHRLAAEGLSPAEIGRIEYGEETPPKPNWRILSGSALFIVITLILGLVRIPGNMEIIFAVSLFIVLYLMMELIRDIDPGKKREIVGIAVIIFVFRAMPGIGPGAGWWQIDVLGFDEAFFGTLRQISSILAIIGMFALRGWMARRPVPYLVVFLSVYSTVMFLPFIGMYYGLHEWTEKIFGFGAKGIAIIDTMADSPMGQVAMIPMLAWIAKEAPRDKKATYFAVMAAFTNLALSLSQLLTVYLNKIFVVERGVYGELGALMIVVAGLALFIPLLAVYLFNPKYHLVLRHIFKAQSGR
ncbi:MAG: hypothetical protein V1867_02935 [Candidatus Falkowbacteria bacterium]